MKLAKSDPLRKAEMPAFPGWAAALGPGIVWMALAQGSGELIWWPYIVAKYGLTFLWMLLPACLLQYPLTYEIGRYTLLTGESIWQGFSRISPGFTFGLWILMIASFLWFGAFASAGATSIAALTGFPAGWEPGEQRLFWAYLVIAVFFLALVFSPVVYQLIEKFMWMVAVVTSVGLLAACSHPQVAGKIPEFLSGLLPTTTSAAFAGLDPKDAEKLLTAITFAGLGGFWTLFYSYWLREKNVGMAKHFGRITSPVTGRLEQIPLNGFAPENSPGLAGRIRAWKRFLLVDSGAGILGNIFTTLMTCLLAYAVLRPQGLLPEGEQIAVVQGEFFAVRWGEIGRAVFLVVAAAFLADTWLSTVDAVSRVHADVLLRLFPGSRVLGPRAWYYLFLVAMTAITAATMPLAQPGPLILLSAVIGFAGTVIFTFAILYLNHFWLPRHVPSAARPGRISFGLMILCAACYSLLMWGYLRVKFGGI